MKIFLESEGTLSGRKLKSYMDIGRGLCPNFLSQKWNTSTCVAEVVTRFNDIETCLKGTQ